ncbi:thioredoxin-dependent thiol peroxidase, partial [Sedimenticola sp.]|uniref:thioredoxin-dependent thiol peroxidase n=1 Tax=Sedimenticola sp. TaxID=1940285 RepID=UPI003D1160E8
MGKKAPAFKLQDQSGQQISSASLKGKPYVLYFYPKDNTPGCTRESCEFRDEQRNFRAAGVTVLGVSPDSVKSHAGFAEKYELPFPLLSDPDKVLAQAYGVWALKKNYGREYWGIVRSTFLIDKQGKISAEWRKV